MTIDPTPTPEDVAELLDLGLLDAGPEAVRLVRAAYRAGWRRGVCEGTGREYPDGLVAAYTEACGRVHGPIVCVTCSAVVEKARECYAIPTCFACLPPPEPLPVLSIVNAADRTDAFNH